MEVGEKAPEFKLKDKDGKAVSLGDIKEDFVVIYFYPKDNTPGCTTEAIEFSADLNAFKKLNTKIIGISGGDEKTKQKFCENHSLTVMLLSDPDFKVSKAYDSYGSKKFMGRLFKGILRNTYIFDKNRKLLKSFNSVKASGHSKEVLSYLETLV